MLCWACSTTPQLQPVDLPDVDETPPIALPAPIVTREIETIVVENEEPKIYAKGSVVFTPAQFERLTANLGELLRWITDARQQLDYYRGDREAFQNDRPDNSSGADDD